MEFVPNTFPDLFFAYSAVWIIIALYLWSVGRRLAVLERRIQESSEERTRSGRASKEDAS